MICLVTINYNDWKTTSEFVKRHISYENIDYFIIVDNASKDGSYEKLRKLEEKNNKVCVLNSGKNGGYGYGNNLGIRFAISRFSADAVIISNPDVLFESKVVDQLYVALQQSGDTFIAAPIMRNSNGEIDHWSIWNIPKSAFDFLLMDLPGFRSVIGKKYYLSIADFKEKNICQADAVAGAFLMMKTKGISHGRPYDEGLFLYYEETALGFRLKQKRKKTTVVLNQTFLHNHSATISKNYKSAFSRLRMQWRSKGYVLRKYYGANMVLLILYYLTGALLCVCISVKQGLIKLAERKSRNKV